MGRTMTKTGAERQREYLKRVREESRRLDVWIDHRALLALARLANHHGISKAKMIERLAMQADDAILKSLSDDEFDRYLGSVTR